MIKRMFKAISGVTAWVLDDTPSFEPADKDSHDFYRKKIKIGIAEFGSIQRISGGVRIVLPNKWHMDGEKSPTWRNITVELLAEQAMVLAEMLRNPDEKDTPTLALCNGTLVARWIRTGAAAHAAIDVWEGSFTGIRVASITLLATQAEHLGGEIAQAVGIG
jgi:hypothetical protein